MKLGASLFYKETSLWTVGVTSLHVAAWNSSRGEARNSNSARVTMKVTKRR